jgi:hypothetical protein
MHNGTAKAAGLLSAVTAAKAVAKRAAKHRHATEWKAFEDFGVMAGPPAQPHTSEVGSTSLLLRWQTPEHLGGKGFDAVGYRISVRYAGDGGFSVHTEDTASESPHCVIEDLAPDTWHEFRVAAITSAGVGADSVPSRPVLTDRAPKLLRELRAATSQLDGKRVKLQRKRAELLALARSGTMALPAAAPGAADAPTSSDCAAGGGASAGGGSPPAGATLTRLLDADEVRVRELKEKQRLVDLERRDELDDAASQWAAEGSYETGSGGAQAAGGRTSGTRTPGAHGRSARGGSAYDASGAYDASAASSCRTADRSGSGGGGSGGFAAAAFAAKATVALQPRRRSAAEERRRIAALDTYTRLFLAEDLAHEEQNTYTPFERESVRRQLRAALSQHVTADGAEEKVRYFDVCLNRARSAVTHNVFDRYAPSELGARAAPI